jgi:hypothetical protein
LAGNPIAYWELNGNLNDSISNNNMSLYAGSAIYRDVPIINVYSGSALKVTPSASIGFYNTNGTIEAFTKYYEDNSFTISFWLSFNNELSSLKYGDTPFTSKKMQIINIGNFGYIYYDFESNTIRFKFDGTNNSEAIIPLRNINVQQYIVASYNGKSRTISISVNGNFGINGYISDTSLFASSKTNLYFILGNSLFSSPTAGQVSSYIISNIAFYNRVLSQREMNNNILWAFNDSKPLSIISLDGNSSFINFSSINTNLEYGKKINGKTFKKQGYIYNLNCDDSGLFPKQINDFKVYSGSSSVINTSSVNGTSMSGVTSLDFYNFYKYANLSQLLITMQLNRSSINNDYIFSISNINKSNYLYLLSSSSNYSLYYYDPKVGSAYNLLSTTASPSTGSANIALCFSKNQITLYTSDSGSATASINSTGIVDNLYFSRNTTLSIGNYNYQNNAFSASIKNVGISDQQVTNFSSFDWLKNNQYFINLTSGSYIVNQYGYFITTIKPITSYTPAGAKINWESTTNCTVSTSIGNGSYSTVIRPESSILGLNSSSPQLVTVKVEINTDYKTLNKNSTFNNLDIQVFNELTTQSNGLGYTYVSEKNSLLYPPVLKNSNYNILANSNNFGVKFQSASTLATSYFTVSTEFGSHNAIEFWYRNDKTASSLSILLSTSSGFGYEPYLYVSNTGYLIYNASAVYVNGTYYPSGLFKVVTNTPYHIATILSSSVTSSSPSIFYLNGNPAYKYTNASSATYGNIAIWNVTPTLQQISDRFKLYTGKKTVSITDDNTTKIIPNINSDTVFMLKIG